MKNKKLLTSILLASVALSGVSYSFANANEAKAKNEYKKDFRDNGFLKKGDRSRGMNLTDEEKASLKDMSREERKAFFELKKAEMKEERESRSTLIDKLLAGETLTNEEEWLRADMIEDRAERKLKRQEREENREEIRNIREKKKAGEELTEDEETILEEMKSKRKDFRKRR